MMTKWDTIQEDVKDQYAYLDEQTEEEEDEYLASLEDMEEAELEKYLALDWNE